MCATGTNNCLGHVRRVCIWVVCLALAGAGGTTAANATTVDVVRPTGTDAQIGTNSAVPVGVLVRSIRDARPVPGACVRARIKPHEHEATTDDTGRATIILTPGDYEFIAVKPGLGSDRIRVEVTASDTNCVELWLSGPVRLAGTVKYSDGTPATNLPLFLIKSYERGGECLVITTDARGRFQREFVPGETDFVDEDLLLVARDEACGEACAARVSVLEDPERIELRLHPGLTVKGTVTSAGRPVSNATVQVRLGRGFLTRPVPGLEVRADAAGRFEVRAIPKKMACVVVAMAPGFAQAELELWHSDTTELWISELPPIELPPNPAQVDIRVIDADGNSVTNALVFVVPRSPQTLIEAKPGPGAVFRADGVAQGRFTVFVNTDECGQSAEYCVFTARTNIEFRLDATSPSFYRLEPRRLVGRVTAPDGRSLTNASVRVLPVYQGWVARTTPAGWYLVRFVLPGGMRGLPAVMALDRSEDLAALYELDEHVSMLDLKLKPGVTIRGRVSDPENKPVTSATCDVSIRVANFVMVLRDFRAQANTNGEFEVRCLPPDCEYELTISAPGYGCRYEEVQAPADTNLIVVGPSVLPPVTTRVAGQVLDKRGQPVPGARVRTYAPGQPQSIAITDPKGWFSIPVCTGGVDCIVYAPSGFARITTEGGQTNLSIVVEGDAEPVPAQPTEQKLLGAKLDGLESFDIVGGRVPQATPILICVFDPDQRPSRRCLRLIAENHVRIREHGVAVLGLWIGSADPALPACLHRELNLPFPIAIAMPTTNSPAWIETAAGRPLPYLILVDTNRVVVKEIPGPEELLESLQSE